MALHSTLPRPGEAFHTFDPRDRRPRDQDTFPTAPDMDRCYAPDLSGHEPDAPLRHRVVWSVIRIYKSYRARGC